MVMCIIYRYLYLKVYVLPTGSNTLPHFLFHQYLFSVPHSNQITEIAGKKELLARPIIIIHVE